MEHNHVHPNIAKQSTLGVYEEPYQNNQNMIGLYVRLVFYMLYIAVNFHCLLESSVDIRK